MPRQRRNLSVVLARAHELGAVSRSQLTKETGLNRSTIAALVAELVELELVAEIEPDPTRLVGRPSPMIVPSQRTVAIAVNPELDAVEVAIVGLGGVVVARSRRMTATAASPPTVNTAVELATEQIRELLGKVDGSRVVGIGLAVPGLVRAADGVVALAPDLDWQDAPLANLLAAETGFETLGANDANLGAVAERLRGAARGFDNVIYLNGGASGIGGGIVAGGEMLGGVSGFAGELGHTLVNTAGSQCRCGSIGCLETEVRRETVLGALTGNTAAAAQTLERCRLHLARALANAVNLFNPQLIVLGGFLSELRESDPVRLEHLVRSMALRGPREEVRLVSASLGRDVLMVGAAELVFARLIADPAGATFVGGRV